MRSLLASSVVLLMVLWPAPPGHGRASAEQPARHETSQPARPFLHGPAKTVSSTALLQTPTGDAEARSQQASPRDIVILDGSSLGTVRLDHRRHSLEQTAKCETCHHPSRREKPARALQQACTECHTKVAIPPMKTKRQAGRVSQCHGFGRHVHRLPQGSQCEGQIGPGEVFELPQEGQRLNLGRVTALVTPEANSPSRPRL
ncbi:MAG: cytochrome c3 family protein [Acidimicrobiia bacterium]|nr:cytochrome c3 family protein [Acidimicrobiia bacterium]